MSYNEREQIEWGNYWWENANQKCKRVLLVGDSVTRGYRSALNRILEEYGYAVDLCAMSATVTDELLGKLLNAFFGVEEYTYEYICLQIGDSMDLENCVARVIQNGGILRQPTEKLC